MTRTDGRPPTRTGARRGPQSIPTGQVGNRPKKNRPAGRSKEVARLLVGVGVLVRAIVAGLQPARKAIDHHAALGIALFVLAHLAAPVLDLAHNSNPTRVRARYLQKSKISTNFPHYF